MSKVTSKLQVTLPKAIATAYGIKPGDEIEWLPGGDSIRVVPARRHLTLQDIPSRLALFDEATHRTDRLAVPSAATASEDRGWSREDLYDRPRPR